MKKCYHEHAKDGLCVAPHCAYYQIHKDKCPYLKPIESKCKRTNDEV